jgi:Ca-activated chloride channel family protein
MRFITSLLFIFYCLPCTFAQYYLRGEVRDEKGKTLSGVKIHIQTKGDFDYSTGDDGSFGLPTPRPIDTITLIMEGYETFRGPISAKSYQVLTLKIVRGESLEIQNRLTSFTKNLSNLTESITKTEMGESYNNLIENGFVNAASNPETGFSLNIDRASYSHIRRFILNQLKPPTQVVRIEQMLNYFNLEPAATRYDSRKKFCFNSAISNCPWNASNQLLYINLEAPKLNLDSVPPSNLVFLIDVSGSMDQPNRLPLLQTAFKLLVSNLRPQDKISIVTYGGGVRIALHPTSGADKKEINEVIDGLVADGDTPGSGAIRMAYDLAKTNFSKGSNNRVILATDGDFNVGQSNDQDLEDMIVKQKQTGINLTCLGVGMGNFKDSKLETLAKQGNGNYAYLDNIEEAEKVLVTEFTKTLYNVAEDAYVNIVFNPAMVRRYRLIGFDNPREAIADTSNKIQGGEVGSGHSLMAIFEVEPKINTSIAENYATLNLQYKLTKTKDIRKESFAINKNVKNIMEIDSAYRFATSVAMFGSLLRGSKYVKDINFESVLQLARTAAQQKSVSQKEFLEVVEKADEIYNPGKKKKK